MFTALAGNASHPAVAALLGLGAAGLAAAVVAMAWSVHARQIRLAERLARRQTLVIPDAGTPGQPGSPAAGEQAGRANGAASPGSGPAAPGNGTPSPGSGTLPRTAGAAAPGPGQAPPVIIEGPDAVVAGEQARYRVRPLGSRKVVAWAAGGGAVSQAPDPAHPDELLLIADQPGDLTLIVRVRDGMTERRGTKPVTAVPQVTSPPPFTLRLFLNGWGLVAVAVLIAGFAAALVALGSLTSSDFIALVSPLAALLTVVAIARGRTELPEYHGGRKGTDKLAAHAARAADPLLPSSPPPGEARVHNQPVL
jgi:hypothetical protein